MQAGGPPNRIEAKSIVTLMFVTGSPDKAVEVSRILGVPVQTQDFALAEVQAVELEDVIRQKAEYARTLLAGRTVLVEDTGLFIEAWAGLPGALTKWFVARVGPGGICAMLTTFGSRQAVAKTVVAVHDGELHLFTGTVAGEIAFKPAGDRGFGFDAIFVPQGDTKTFAQMLPHEKDRYSMRRVAFEKMRADYIDQPHGRGARET